MSEQISHAEAIMPRARRSLVDAFIKKRQLVEMMAMAGARL